VTRYRLTRAAADDIEHIYVEGLVQFGFEQAEAYHLGLFGTFAFLAEYPAAARPREELPTPVRIHRYRSHLIVYEIVDGEVLVVRIRHGREDWLGQMD